ncbi:Bifunctional oligoribonuclease and PAP phosphatase nrnA [uncultured Roseburia sp.]|uniref:Cyclic-di-AMP phosphodiesterase n=1 Tax=Brotonthovivens ammoniilytica TaxID=2981725 RepID=A0ABT2TL69_9FIRM|nr:DHH family phosphoesterase [Brotonthovivens ammoniilytica]MCU6762954.1 DHH family phosphoesterase [Brotonthovivens ammoniilytica]SCI94760.1 Bifunctional oligoribonuclease and PAP phosphatase nrnA [uncultured Roseburia sp.]
MGSEIKLKGKLKAYILTPLMLTFLFLAMDIWMYFLNIKAGVFGTVCVGVYFVIVLAAYQYHKPVILNELIDFATQYGTVQKRLLNEFEIPYGLLDSNGRILWMNKEFSRITGKEKRYNKSIASIFPEMTREQLLKSDEQEFEVPFEQQIYRASLKKIYFTEMMREKGLVDTEDKQQYLMVVYLYDETKLNRYRKEIQDVQLVAGLVYIDNFEEVMEKVEEVKQSLLLALVDRKINKYFSEVDALIKKTEKDKYFVVFKQQYLGKLEEDKYSILEEVKTVKVGNEMAVTLSIGIGSGCKEYMQNYEHARTSIDLALGRGGDQVVRKTENNVYYYGGNSRQVEKNTRVKARVKSLALREIMMSRDKFFVMGHCIADIDSFGAAIGIYCAGRQLGKKVQIVLNEVTTSLRPVKEGFSVENGYPEDMFISSKEAIENYDYHTAVVVVDTNRPNYTECPQLLNKSKTIVVFDHHRQGKDVIKNAVLSYIEPYASSTCEMIAEVLQYFDEDIKLSTREADSIYAGILIDTNNFMTKTGVRTFEAAAYLKRCGAEVTRVRKMLRNDMNAYKARAEAVRHAQVYRGQFAISVCPADDIESPTVACAQAANELLNIIGIRASFVLTEYQGKIYISSRSIDEINVQRIMERLGGGGHMNTAGAQLTNCTMEEACETIQDTLDEMMKEGDIK